MKKLLTLLLCLTSVAAAAAPERVIPWPDGADTQSEGASSAPAAINHEHSRYFAAPPNYFELSSSGTLIMLPHFPTYQQTREHTCGSACGLMVLHYYGRAGSETEFSLAQKMGTQPYPIGTSLSGMVKAFRELGWNVDSKLDHPVFASYDAFRDFVIDTLKAGRPIMVENVDWGGHWRVVIGIDTMNDSSTLDDVLIMADPYDTADHKQDGYVAVNGEKFFAMWFDHSMLPPQEREQPWLIAWPKEEKEAAKP